MFASIYTIAAGMNVAGNSGVIQKGGMAMPGLRSDAPSSQRQLPGVGEELLHPDLTLACAMAKAPSSR
jgi:hypothetical protein